MPKRNSTQVDSMNAISSNRHRKFDKSFWGRIRKRMVSESEVVGLAPSFLLAFTYFVTDILTFNRLRTRGRCPILTPLQRRVALVYPVWVFLLWVEGLSTRRGNVAVLAFVGSVNTLVGWGTTVLVLNDGSPITSQQWSSLFGRYLTNILWWWYNFSMYTGQQ